MLSSIWPSQPPRLLYDEDIQIGKLEGTLCAGHLPCLSTFFCCTKVKSSESNVSSSMKQAASLRSQMIPLKLEHTTLPTSPTVLCLRHYLPNFTDRNQRLKLQRSICVLYDNFYLTVPWATFPNSNLSRRNFCVHTQKQEYILPFLPDLPKLKRLCKRYVEKPGYAGVFWYSKIPSLFFELCWHCQKPGTLSNPHLHMALTEI